MRNLTDTEKLELIQGAILPRVPLTMEKTLDEIDFDSLDAEAVAAMATEYTELGAVEVDEHAIQRCKTFGELVRLIWPEG